MQTEQVVEQDSEADIAAATAGGEFLTFRLGEEEYGVEILKVQEIRGYDAVTRIANAPDYIKGVVNLRGIIVPIFDLRIKFNLADPQYTELTVVIILKLAGRVVGVVVDSVSEVINLSPAQMRPAPKFGATVDAQHIVGLGTVDDRMLILIDIEKLMSSKDVGLFDGTTVH